MRLKEIRKRKGYSQTDLAEVLDCSRTVISNIENDKRDINAVELYKLSKFLDVEPEYLINAVDPIYKTTFEEKLLEKVEEYKKQQQTVFGKIINYIKKIFEIEYL